MNHKKLQLMLSAFVDKELDENEMSAVREHLDSCAACRKRLQELRSIGVRVAMDDFGTGYASLAGLRELPVDIVKVDIRFIQGLHDVRIDRAIVAAVIDLAKELGIVAIAEGVETAEQRSDLVALDCPAGQGFLFSEPMRAQDMAGWRSTAFDGEPALLESGR